MAKTARLLDDIIPNRYRLRYDIALSAFRFTVAESIDFRLVHDGATLTFHAVGVTIAEAKLEGGQVAEEITLDEDSQTVTLRFGELIPAGDHTLDLSFTGDIGEGLHGLYRSRYVIEGQDHWMAVTQFEPAHAREAFVGIDEPAAKAVFELSITIDNTLTAISNTDPASVTTGPDGRQTVLFEPMPKMSTYLLAFVIGQFEHVEAQTPEGVTVRVYTTPDKIGQASFALDVGCRALSFYTDYFGIDYPLEKYDMIAVPDFAAGAMENWGAVTFRETDLLLDQLKVSQLQRQRVVEVVAHELSHQWFGNLVTMAWWNDLWLNEGFASWGADLAREHLFPEWQIWSQFVSEGMSYALELDSLAQTHPIEATVNDPREVEEIFDGISYQKGSSIIRMLHDYLGDAAFRDGLHRYLERYSYGNATTDDLWAALGEASGRPVKKLMAAWTSQPGYPLLSMEAGEIRQRRFYASPREVAKANDTDAVVWPVPFTAVTPASHTAPVLCSLAAQPAPADVTAAEWFKPNAGQMGFFRWQYTPAMLDSLAEPLGSGLLTAVDRYGVVNDVFATTAAGLTDSAMALRLLASLRNEQDYVVWTAVSDGFSSLLAIAEDDALRTKLEAFGRWLIRPNYERLGWDARPGEATFDTLMRSLVLSQAIRLDDGDAAAEGYRRFQSYLGGGPLDANIRVAALYATARHGDTEDFDVIQAHYQTETSPQAKINFLTALSRFRKPDLIKRTLELAISPEVRPQDTVFVLAHGFVNPDARDQTWKFTKKHWSLFVGRYGKGGHMIERFPTMAANGFATHAMAGELEHFFTSHPHPSTKRATAQAVETINLKAGWLERDRAAIETFLDQWSTAELTTTNR